MTPMPDPNAPECDCRALERWSNEPSVPIEFDAELNEYHILGTDGWQIMIYHCPFCGGRTPTSRRDEMFMHITHAEMERLKAVTGKLKTLTEVLTVLGTPDWDNPTGVGVTKPDDAGRPQTKHYRQLIYANLSPTANVKAIVYADERIQFSFTPKDRTGA